MGRLITRLKKVFQNKLHSSADQNSIAFLKLQNVLKSRIHFITSWRGGGGSYNGGYFFLQVDEPINGGGLTCMF